MKTTVSVTVDAEVLAEVRGKHLPVSAICNDALRAALGKPAEENDELGLLLELKEARQKVQELAKIDGNERLIKSTAPILKREGFLLESVKDKIKFWREIYSRVRLFNLKQSVLKENPPTPPKEKV